MKITAKRKFNKFISDVFTFSLMMSMFLHTHVSAGSAQGAVDAILIDVTTVLLVIAGCVCLGKLAQIGIMFMMSSATEKSNAKTAILPWLLGTIVCFGATWIGPLIIGIFKHDTSEGVLSSY